MKQSFARETVNVIRHREKSDSSHCNGCKEVERVAPLLQLTLCLD